MRLRGRPSRLGAAGATGERRSLVSSPVTSSGSPERFADLTHGATGPVPDLRPFLGVGRHVVRRGRRRRRRPQLPRTQERARLTARRSHRWSPQWRVAWWIFSSSRICRGSRRLVRSGPIGAEGDRVTFADASTRCLDDPAPAGSRVMVAVDGAADPAFPVPGRGAAGMGAPSGIACSRDGRPSPAPVCGRGGAFIR